MRYWCVLTGSPHCWLRRSRWDSSPRFHPRWETCPRSTSAAAGELWSRSPSGRQVGNQSQGLVPKSWIGRMLDISGSHPLVVRIDSYSHYPASRQTSKLSVLELHRKMQGSLDWRFCVWARACVCLHGPVLFFLLNSTMFLRTFFLFFFFYLLWHRPWNEIPRGLLTSGETVQDGLARYLSLQTNLRNTIKNWMSLKTGTIS